MPEINTAFVERSRFEEAYADDAPARGPWDVPFPQPVIVDAVAKITGRVLDAGCGTGENAIFLAEQGRDVTGIDFVETAIQKAREKAKAKGIDVRFLAKDALTLSEWDEQFDNIVDSAVYHVFSDVDAAKYIQGLSHILKPGGRLFLICFSNEEPGTNGPRRVPKQRLFDEFASGWTVKSIDSVRYRILPEFDGVSFTAGGPKAWFAIIKKN